MKKIIYSKYSNERAEQFSVRTDIVEQNGEKSVVKMPVSEAARGHVEGMYDIFQKLQATCNSEEYEVLPCKREADGVQFPYIQGDTLEMLWDALLVVGGVSRVEAELISYCELVRKMFSDTAFCMTDSFCDVFGDVNLPDGMMAHRVSNIDMLAGNIICCGDKRYLIDYEWTFFFPVPVDFIVYRVLHYYLYANELRAALRGLNLFSRCGISVSCMEPFEIMERNFQNYITGKKVPLREMYPFISPGVFPAKIRAGQEAVCRRNSVLQLFYSYGSGYIEENSMYFPMKDYQIRLEQEIPTGVTNIRIDPGTVGTLCMVKRLCFDTSMKDIESYHSIGCMLRDNWIVFDREDPQITLDDIPKEAGRLFLELLIVPLEKDILHIWAENCRHGNDLLKQYADEQDELKKETDLLEQEKCHLEDQNRHLENEVANLKAQIVSMRSTKVWRTWEKMQKITGRGSNHEND